MARLSVLSFNLPLKREKMQGRGDTGDIKFSNLDEFAMARAKKPADDRNHVRLIMVIIGIASLADAICIVRVHRRRFRSSNR